MLGSGSHLGNLGVGDRAFDGTRHAGNETAVGHGHIGQHHRIGGNQALPPDGGFGEEGAVVAQQAAVADAVAVHHHAVADGHIILDHQPVAMHHGTFLDVDIVADGDGIAVAADGDAGPDAGVFADGHIAYHIGELADPGGGGDFGFNSAQAAYQSSDSFAWRAGSGGKPRRRRAAISMRVGAIIHHCDRLCRRAGMAVGDYGGGRARRWQTAPASQAAPAARAGGTPPAISVKTTTFK